MTCPRLGILASPALKRNNAAKRESWLAVNRRRQLAPILCLVLAACGHAKPASQPATATPAAAPTPAVEPRARPTPRPSTAAPVPPAATAPPPTAAPAPSASSQPTPSATPIALPPDAPPQILSVDINETTVHAGDTVSGMVVTSSNVASVEVRVATYGMSLAKVGVGRFALQYTLGALPFFVHGTYQMRIIARNARGDAAQQTLPITVR